MCIRDRKKVNDLGLIAPMIGRVLDWIDPNDLIVRRRPHKSLQLPNQIVMVRITCAECVETRSKTGSLTVGASLLTAIPFRRPRFSQKYLRGRQPLRISIKPQCGIVWLGQHVGLGSFSTDQVGFACRFMSASLR